jgi:hypothetical protein
MKPIPGPYSVMKLYDDTLLIRRAWDLLVKPGDTRTFGSMHGAHIADIKFIPGGTATPTFEQAVANAELLAAAPTLRALLRDTHKMLCDIEANVGPNNFLQISINREAFTDLLQRADAVLTHLEEMEMIDENTG